MADQKEIKKVEKPQELMESHVVDQKDLAALWAIGILVSLLISFAGTSWNPARYEARQSTSLDPTEVRVENSQNQLVSDALNALEIEYDSTMEKLVKLQPLYLRVLTDVTRLILFPSGPIVIIGLLIRKTVLYVKGTKTKK